MATKREILERERMFEDLGNNGISREDSEALRRISMTLHRWHEMECGTDYGVVERDEETGRPYWYSSRTGRRHSSPIADRERGALRRLEAIMARYPILGYYVQGDPRGCALYILRPGDVRDGEDVRSVYNRGIAVY
jgi:hypothetical protein